MDNQILTNLIVFISLICFLLAALYPRSKKQRSSRVQAIKIESVCSSLSTLRTRRHTRNKCYEPKIERVYTSSGYGVKSEAKRNF